MRIRFFNTFEPVSPFYRDLVPYLAEQGHEIEIVISSAEYRTGRERLEDLLPPENVRLTRIPAGIKLADSSLKKLWVVLAYMIGSAFVTLFGRGTDLNFFLTQPPMFQVWGRFLKALRRQPYSCLVMDLYPDALVNFGKIKKGSIFEKVAHSISRGTLRKAKNVVVIGRCMQRVLEKDGIEPNRIVNIPNWVNETEVRCISKEENSLRKELNLSDKFICLYSGNIGISHNMNDLLEVAVELRAEEDIRFVIVGGGIKKAQLEQFRDEHQLENLMLLPYQPTSRLSESLGLGDFHFVSLRQNFSGLVVPSKAYGALAAGKPIVYQGSEESELALMIKEHDLGFVVNEGDVEGLKEAILSLYRDPQRLAALSKNAERSNEVYNRLESLKTYASLFATGN